MEVRIRLARVHLKVVTTGAHLNMIVSIRRQFRKASLLRSLYFFCFTYWQRIRSTKQLVAQDLLGTLNAEEDPWNYSSSPDESDRFRSALTMLDAVGGAKTFATAFEVGCSEGFFTCMLAPRCQTLLAVDISQVSLERAARRCPSRNVRFERWDLFKAPVPSGFELTIVMDVLELYFNPSDVRHARERLIASVAPGGYLLLGNSRQNEIFETARWGRWMLRGGKRIADFFAQHPQLELVASETRGIYVNALFRKEANALPTSSANELEVDG